MMPPVVRRMTSDYRRVLLPCLVIVFVNVVVYVGAVRPLASRSAGVATRAAEARAALAAATEDEARAEALVTGTARATTQLQQFYGQLLPTDLSAARRLTYATIPRMARESGVQYEARTTKVEAPQKGSRVWRLAMRLDLHGSYPALRKFLDALEAAPEFLVVDGVTLADADGGEPLALTLDVSTYYRAGRDAR